MNVTAENTSAASSAKPPVAADSSRLALLHPFVICVFVWALDFKSATSGGGAAIQGVIFGLYLSAGFLVVISAIYRGIGMGPVWLLAAAVGVFVIEASASGLVHGQEFYAIFVNVIPSFIFASSAALAYITLESLKDDPSAFLKLLRYACAAYVMVHLGMVILTRGSINLAESRYEVLSGATTAALAIIATGLLTRLSKFDIGIFLVNLLVAVISVTRTLLFVLAVQIALVAAARPLTMFKPATLKAVGVLCAALLCIVTLDLSAGTGMTERWVERVTVSKKAGSDPTSLTRKAENRFMLTQFTATPDTLLFGNGLAAVTSLIGPEARLAERIVGEGPVNLHSVGFGHENYVSILFTSGLLGGGFLLIMLFVNGMQAFWFLRSFKLSVLSQVELHLGLWGALIVLGTLATGLYGGTLADRGISLWYGVGTGMLYWVRHRAARAAAEERSALATPGLSAST